MVLQEAKHWKAWMKANTGALASEHSQMFGVAEWMKTQGARIEAQIPELHSPAGHRLG